MSPKLLLATENIKRWRKDPVAYVVENFKIEPDEWQKKVLNRLPHDRRHAMKACKGPGKTCVLAWICWWFLTCFLHPKIAAISISADNLADGLWAEMSKWQQRSPLLKEAFQWTKTRIFLKAAPETWFMSARSWSKSASKEQQANVLAGLHADNIMFVLDEAGGIPDGVAATAEAVLANDMGGKNKVARIVMAGNPTHNEGPLWRACTKEADIWSVTEITSDPDDPMRTPRVSAEWAREQIKKYGRDNPWVLVNVFGKFPPSSINALIGPDEARAAVARMLTPDAYLHSQKRIGVDVARFGDDATVLAPRQGLRAFNLVVYRNKRNPWIASAVAMSKKKWGSELEIIDGTGGFGGGVIDSLIQLGHAPIEYQASGSPLDSRYANKRAEVHFEMAEWIKRGGQIPDDPELIAELTAPTYTFNARGELIIEPKDAIKLRLGRSPDKADALSMTFALPEQVASLGPFGHSVRENHKAKTDWNPFEDAG